jgi:hypothetical protein
MLTKIKCPLCNEKFELNEALDSDLREQILGSVKEEHQKHLDDTRKKAIEETKRQIDEENKKKSKKCGSRLSMRRKSQSLINILVI